MAPAASFLRGSIYVEFEVQPNSSSQARGNVRRTEKAFVDTGCDYALIIPEDEVDDFPVYDRVADGASIVDVHGARTLHDSFSLDIDWIGGRKTITVVAVVGSPLLAGRPMFQKSSQLNIDWRTENVALF